MAYRPLPLRGRSREELAAGTKDNLRAITTIFLNQLMDYDLHDHPQVFEVLDEIARERGLTLTLKCHHAQIEGVVLKRTED